ncbi:MAG: hypothetical protein ACUVV4_06775 [Candidatus Bathyarchaeia archaeon]
MRLPSHPKSRPQWKECSSSGNSPALTSLTNRDTASAMTSVMQTYLLTCLGLKQVHAEHIVDD